MYWLPKYGLNVGLSLGLRREAPRQEERAR